MASPLPVPAPERTPETDVFWRATAEGRLLLAHCDECGGFIWYPRALCPSCGSAAVSWIEASGRGSVYSFTVVHRAPGRFADAVPYVTAYVELEEGPRVLTNVVGCDPGAVYIGQPVRVVFCDTGEGCALYRFEPSAQP
jgi:uncharacterized OB-fold protein